MPPAPESNPLDHRIPDAPSPSNPDLCLCGLRVRTEVPVQNAPRWEGAECLPHVHIHWGRLPSDLPGTVFNNGLLQIDGEGAALIHLHGVGRFLVDPSGRHVLTDRDSVGGKPGVEMALLGTLLGVVSYRNGRIPLHGSFIQAHGQGVAFVGPSGAGKSTLAAAFHGKGVPVLADDLLPVEVMDRHLRVHLHPGGLRLHRGAVDGLGLGGEDGLDRVRGGKWGVPLPTARNAPAPIHSIYLLARGAHEMGGSEPWVETLEGPVAVAGLGKALFRRRAARTILGEEGVLRALGSLAERAAVQRLHYPSSFEGLHVAVERVMGHEEERPCSTLPHPGRDESAPTHRDP